MTDHCTCTSHFTCGYCLRRSAERQGLVSPVKFEPEVAGIRIPENTEVTTTQDDLIIRDRQ